MRCEGITEELFKERFPVNLDRDFLEIVHPLEVAFYGNASNRDLERHFKEREEAYQLISSHYLFIKDEYLQNFYTKGPGILRIRIWENITIGSFYPEEKLMKKKYCEDEKARYLDHKQPMWIPLTQRACPANIFYIKLTGGES